MNEKLAVQSPTRTLLSILFYMHRCLEHQNPFVNCQEFIFKLFLVKSVVTINKFWSIQDQNLKCLFETWNKMFNKVIPIIFEVRSLADADF